MGHSIQADTYRSLIASRLPYDLALSLLLRVRKRLGAKYCDDKVLEAMRRTLKLARSMAPQAGWALVRTWWNGWVTFSRVGAGSNPCIFGCTGDVTCRDSLQHYLVCPAHWKPIIELSKVDWNVWMDVEILNSLALATAVDPALVDHAIEAMIASNAVATDTFHTANTFELLSEERLGCIAWAPPR